jgi:hypothetical protein
VSVAVVELEPNVAVTVTEALVVTFAGLNVKVADLAPAAIVTDAGTGTAVEFELFSVTVTPEEPAAPDRVTVPVTAVEPLPTIEEDESAKLDNVGAVTAKVAVLATPLVPVRVTDVLAFTA